MTMLGEIRPINERLGIFYRLFDTKASLLLKEGVLGWAFS